MTVQAPAATLPVLRDYEVLEKIASGSMAAVYKARAHESGEVVALKVPFPAVADNPVLLQRFQEEFRVGSTLRHPGLVRALAFGREGPAYYIVMEFVEGVDLCQRLEEGGPLPEAEAVGIIVQIARALHEAHRHGIIHRDVKPDNILLTAGGGAKLADLGLIKDLEGELGLTRTGRGLGSPNFIAPEQFNDARDAGAACDVYSLGATLYMAVTGELPFRSRSLAATLKKKENNQLVPPRELVPSLSERLDWAIRRAVQANPRQRHASCLEFIRALTEGGAPAPGADAPAGLAGGRRGAPNRRRSLRYPCTLATVCEVGTSVHDGEEGSEDRWEATVQNLSVAGVGLLLQRRFEPGTVVNVLLQSPDGRVRRSLEMQILRVSPAAGGRWATGGVFNKELTKEDLRQLV
jgi:tRNA A-37 threonylcarbamoyl transferase component Bud32